MNDHFVESLIPDVVSSLKRIEESLVRPDSRPGEVSFANSNLTPPSQFYIQSGMQLRLRTTTTRTNEVVNALALVLVENRLVNITLSSDPFTDTSNTIVFPLTVTGFLVSVSIGCTVANQRGHTFSVLQMLDQTGNFLFTLYAGYVTVYAPASYPPIRIEQGFSGHGCILQTPVPLVVGSTAFWQPAGNRLWNLLTVSAWFTTDANVADRFLVLGARGGGAEQFRKKFYFPLVASSVYKLTASPEGQDTPLTVAAASLYLSVSIPPLLIPVGGYFKMDIENAQVGDAYTLNLSYALVEEYINV